MTADSREQQVAAWQLKPHSVYTDAMLKQFLASNVIEEDQTFSWESDDPVAHFIRQVCSY